MDSLIGMRLYISNLIDTMGNDPAKSNSTQPASTQYMRIGHERFQRYRYVPDQDQLEITIDVPEERQMKQWENEVSTVTNGFEHRDCLLLPVKHEYTPKGWCGNTGSAKIYYEYFPYIFSEELENRISTGKFFDEEQLWYLLYCLVGCAKDFSKIQKRIGDVRPHNIFINQQGQIKIACLLSWPYEKTNFDKTAFEKTLTYLSPEEIALLGKGNLENKTNQVLSQSFSIGLTLLEAGLLFDAKELYSVDNRAIDIGKLRKKIDEWYHLQFGDGENVVSYSPLLKDIVAALCSPNPEEREISLDVEDLLRPFEDEIMNLRSFDHNNIDFQLHQPNKPPTQPQIYSSHPVSSIPFSQSQQGQQQTFTIPPQNYRVGNSIQQRQLINYGPPAENYRQTIQQPTKVLSQVGYGSTIPYQNAPSDPQSGYKEVFTQYAAHLPERPNPIMVPNQYYEQQFHKYSAVNQYPQAHQQVQIPIVQNQPVKFIQQQPVPIQTFSTPKTNIINPHNALNQNTNEFGSNPFFTNSNFQQSQYVTSSNTVHHTSSLPQQFVPVSKSNDFLKKIDQQLQNSRKLYPS